MNTKQESGVPTPSGIPAIVFACALGVLAAGFLAYFEPMAAWPLSLLRGVSLGGALGGLIALLCGFHLRRGFCYLFGAAIGALIGNFGPIAMMSNSGYIPERYESLYLSDAFALGVIVVGVLGGAAVRRFVTRFGAKARAWAWCGAGLGVALAVPLDCAYQIARQIAEKGERLLMIMGDRGATLEMPDVDAFFAFGLALIGAIVVGWIGALAGASRDSALQRPTIQGLVGPNDSQARAGESVSRL